MNEQAFEVLVNGNREIYANLYEYPNECPHCHKHIIPKYKSDYLSGEQYTIYITLICPNTKCDKPFIAQYGRENHNNYYYEKIVRYSVITKTFSSEIIEISPQFQKIYNEAFFAEQNNLFEICGVAYRKSLEFLLKDYLIKLFPEKKELIIKNSIMNCISSHVDDTRLKTTSKRAIWLGNDHTHYEKKWNDKNLSDLKTLIKLTVNWIESDVLTKKFNDSMQ
ncbi:hypothetical protein MWU65_07985 [Cellulophaga sp. F20128]|uniref:hypothetical protein n=1 Tax=Cellulophaga sp. F20128 TaxID=2926413 RepID=UPI001FF4315B|nr:hypothetical protein [Cellulophaga sp. F20128]MCK0157112.1 hypothetical protein [Cellulophaga sp. F20128]